MTDTFSLHLCFAFPIIGFHWKATASPHPNLSFSLTTLFGTWTLFVAAAILLWDKRNGWEGKHRGEESEAIET